MGFEINPWKIVCRGWDEALKGRIERLTSIGNGYMGLQGCFEEDFATDPETWLSGAEVPDLNSPRAVRCLRMDGIGIEIDGEPLDLTKADVQDFTAELDMQTGLALRKFVVNTPNGRVAFKVERFVSLAQKELLAIRISILPEYDAQIALKPYLNGKAAEQYWEMLAEEESEDGAALLVKIKENQQNVPQMAAAVAMSCWADGLELEERRYDRGYAEAVYSCRAEAGDLISLEKYVLCFNSREYEQNVLTTVALRAAARARELGYDELRSTQAGAWKARWNACDVKIDGNDMLQQQIRYALFGLLSAYSGEEACAMSIDDKFISLPAYMAIAGQDAARQLLSCSGGDEKQHAGLAHAIFDYATFTGDFEFIRKDGLDALCSIARFFSQKAKDGRLENSWYLSRMASWSIGLFLTQVHRASPDRLAELDLTKTETAQMLEWVQKLHDPSKEQDKLMDESAEEALLGLYFLNHLYDDEVIRRAFEQSKQSKMDSFALCVRCILASQLGEGAEAAALYNEIDTETITGMASKWLAIVHGFGGMRTAEGLRFNPMLPEGWQSYSFGIQYRGRLIRLSVTANQIEAERVEGQPLALTLCEEEMLLRDRIIRPR